MYAEQPPSGRVSGLFMSFGVGPRFPIADFSSTTNLGYGVNIEFSYTDNEFLPVFLYTKIGFEQFPGSQDFYRETDYSNYHVNAIPVNIGARYYFSPILENIILLMPIAQISAAYCYSYTLHEFDKNAGKNNFTKDKHDFGFSAGAGFSMFMMELVASYNYLPEKQFVSLDLKVRIPLSINF
jgi:hypothetical protein